MIIEIVMALFLIQCANILSRLIGRRRDRAPLRFNTGSSSLKSRGFRIAPWRAILGYWASRSFGVPLWRAPWYLWSSPIDLPHTHDLL